ncbi:YesL family protein [Terribacillus halophilus]|uniref:YesL family protein n=1 Tax=Terribacillus halophilus TaxID=361279 RepID=UPI0039825283
MERISSSIYLILEWITRFAYLNVLWILFTFTGGIILGFFPSTTAMFTIIRNWLRGESDAALLGTFWSSYKKEFWKSNKLGIFVAMLMVIIILDIWYLHFLPPVLSWFHIPLLVFILFSFLFLFYLFPAFVHFDLNVRSIIKHAFLIMLIHPLHTLMIIICLACLTLIMYALPSLAFLFAGSAFAFTTMWLCLHAFTGMNKKNSA